MSSVGSSTTRAARTTTPFASGSRRPCKYVPVDGELELLPGLRLVPAPGHTRGTQVVVVETGGCPVVVGGDVAVWFGELDEPHTEGQLLVRALDPSWSGCARALAMATPHRLTHHAGAL